MVRQVLKFINIYQTTTTGSWRKSYPFSCDGSCWVHHSFWNTRELHAPLIYRPLFFFPPVLLPICLIFVQNHRKVVGSDNQNLCFDVDLRDLAINSFTFNHQFQFSYDTATVITVRNHSTSINTDQTEKHHNWCLVKHFWIRYSTSRFLSPHFVTLHTTCGAPTETCWIKRKWAACSAFIVYFYAEAVSFKWFIIPSKSIEFKCAVEVRFGCSKILNHLAWFSLCYAF